MALGPIVKVVAQAAVMGVTILLRAIPAAYGAALQNARKSGVDAASQSAKNKTNTIFGSKRMELDEALLILNIEKKNLLSSTSSTSSSTTSTTEQIQNQYNKYFQANAVEKGGSFYLQSKIYRAKEMLDEYVKEQQLKEKQQQQQQQKK